MRDPGLRPHNRLFSAVLYFGGDYIGCDGNTGLGMPDFKKLAQSYGINFTKITPKLMKDREALSKIFNSEGLKMILVPIDPEQTYFPKIHRKYFNICLLTYFLK